VINIAPDITNTAFFNDLNFKPTTDPQSFIEPEDIADIIAHTLTLRPSTVVTNITLEPQKFKLEKTPKQKK